jgi:hypothetical protein
MQFVPVHPAGGLLVANQEIDAGLPRSVLTDLTPLVIITRHYDPRALAYGEVIAGA